MSAAQPSAKGQAAVRAAALLRGHRVAALGTNHGGAPSVTMTPYALVFEPFALIVLTSALASHTADMRSDPRVGVMIADAEADGRPVHALARVSLQAAARALGGDPLHDRARRAYETRFPDMSGLFQLGDFELFALEPETVRVIAGFAQAASVTPQSVAAALLDMT